MVCRVCCCVLIQSGAIIVMSVCKIKRPSNCANLRTLLWCLRQCNERNPADVDVVADDVRQLHSHREQVCNCAARVITVNDFEVVISRWCDNKLINAQRE